ncbi:MAG TPA: hypothetical protein VKW06_02485 [Candidatus Angelobacter sp.]|nr:hypothetical protein [Candidatus Angelobacter sp.]
MKFVSGVVSFVFAAALACLAQPAGNSSQPPNPPDLDPIINQVRQATQAANVDLGRLQIGRWKGDSENKVQMQQVADSLKKNLTYAVPDLIGEVQSSKGSLSSTFRLYHNLNVVYEFLNSLAEAAGAYGKKEEYEPLAGDATSLDNARQGLSTYIEKAAARLERPTPTPAPVPTPTPKKVIIDDDETPKKKPATTKKKKTSAPPAKPSPTPQ